MLAVFGPLYRAGRMSLCSPPYALRGEVAPSYGDGGVESPTEAPDPSVSDYRDTSPAKLGRKMRSAPTCECPPRGRYARFLASGM